MRIEPKKIVAVAANVATTINTLRSSFFETNPKALAELDAAVDELLELAGADTSTRELVEKLRQVSR